MQAALGIAIITLAVSFFVVLLVLNALVELYLECRTYFRNRRLRRD